MVTDVKMMGNAQIFRVALCVVFLMLVVWPALGQELKQVSPTLAAKIAESGRKRVAVVDFTDLQGNVTELGRYLAEELSGALVNDARGFRVIDRAHLKAILQEHKLAATGLIDPEAARQLGKIAGVDTLVTGTITSAFGDTVRVMVKALDVSTAEIIGQATADIPKTEWIQRLLGQGVATGMSAPGGSNEGPSPQPAVEPKSAAVSVEENDLQFVVKPCGRSGETLKCTGSVTNKARMRQSVSLLGVKFVDNLGNEYPAARVSLPAAKLSLGIPAWTAGSFLRTAGAQRPIAAEDTAELEHDLPVNFSVGADHTDPAATRVTLVIDYGFGCIANFAIGRRCSGGGKVALRNIPIR
jgi:hypothetical protein